MKRFAIAAVFVATLAGCEESQAPDTVTVEEIEIGEGLEVEREIAAWTFWDWSGTTATDFASRTQAMEIDAAGGVSTGGSKWTFADSIGSWAVKGLLGVTTCSILMTLIGTAGSVLGSTGGVGQVVSGVAQTLTFPIPILGSIVQRARGNLGRKQFKQVVSGGDKFRQALAASGYDGATQDEIWGLYKASQRQAQDGLTSDAVRAARG